MHEELTRWFHEHQRALPWRESYHPYHVWISEVMLQQTQVETVLPYFQRFIAAFPDPATLAAAGEQQVFSHWAGLGYYSRARNLMAAARVIVEQHSGRVPEDYDSLRRLPGVGQYTAGAILSIAYNKPFPVVDGNVRRVLSRLYGWADDRPKRLWDRAGELVRQAEPRAVNQAIMELGATVCSFKAPRCLVCPLQHHCVAYRTGMQQEIPAIKKRPATVRVQLFAVVQFRGRQVLMRPEKGFWVFPTFSEMPSGNLAPCGSCRHTITHHRLEVQVFTGKLQSVAGFKWKQFGEVPVSSLTKKIHAVAFD